MGSVRIGPADKIELPHISRLVPRCFPTFVSAGDSSSRTIESTHYYNEHMLDYRVVIRNHVGEILASGKTIPMHLDHERLQDTVPEDLSELFERAVHQHKT